MLWKFAFLPIIFMLNGCSSEIDKCVEAYMVAWDGEQEKAKMNLMQWEKDQVATENRDQSIEREQGHPSSSGKPKTLKDFGFELAFGLDKLAPSDKPKVDARSRERVVATTRYACMQAYSK